MQRKGDAISSKSLPLFDHTFFKTTPLFSPTLSFKLNQYLKEKLKDSNDKLSLSQGLVQRLSKVAHDTRSISNESLMLDDDTAPLVEGSLTFEGSRFNLPAHVSACE